MPEETRVRVRREHPSALAWALALMLTMLCVYLLTLGLALAPEAAIDAGDGAPRVTEEVSFGSAEAYFVSLGRFDTATEARIEAARYTPRGAAGYALETADGFPRAGRRLRKPGRGGKRRPRAFAERGPRLRGSTKNARTARVCASPPRRRTSPL